MLSEIFKNSMLGVKDEWFMVFILDCSKKHLYYHFFVLDTISCKYLTGTFNINLI